MAGSAQRVLPAAVNIPALALAWATVTELMATMDAVSCVALSPLLMVRFDLGFGSNTLYIQLRRRHMDLHTASVMTLPGGVSWRNPPSILLRDQVWRSAIALLRI